MAAQNLLYSGMVDVAFIVGLLRRPNLRYDSSPHDRINNVTVDVFRINRRGVDWYIKTYFEHYGELTKVIISVHD